MDQARYSLEDLCKITAVNKRKIRYYLQIGLLDKPEGTTRGAYYVERHLNQLRAIIKWTDAGLSLSRIKRILVSSGDEDEQPLPPPPSYQAGELHFCSHIFIAEGIELVIDPRALNLSGVQLASISDGIVQVIREHGISIKEGDGLRKSRNNPQKPLEGDEKDKAGLDDGGVSV